MSCHKQQKNKKTLLMLGSLVKKEKSTGLLYLCKIMIVFSFVSFFRFSGIIKSFREIFSDGFICLY